MIIFGFDSLTGGIFLIENCNGGRASARRLAGMIRLVEEVLGVRDMKSGPT
jgi:hypothetical protein